MEHRHFTLNLKKQYSIDRYEVEEQYIFSSNGDDPAHYVLDYTNMEKVEDVMRSMFGHDYPVDNFKDYFNNHSMEDFAKLVKQWSIKMTKLD